MPKRIKSTGQKLDQLKASFAAAHNLLEDLHETQRNILLLQEIAGSKAPRFHVKSELAWMQKHRTQLLAKIAKVTQ